MVGPDGDRSWSRVDYKSIETYKRIISTDSFCDEQGNENPDFPIMHWRKEFGQTGSDTTVAVEITFAELADLGKIIKMRFEEGFKAGLGNLDRYLGAHAKV